MLPHLAGTSLPACALNGTLPATVGATSPYLPVVRTRNARWVILLLS